MLDLSFFQFNKCTHTHRNVKIHISIRSIKVAQIDFIYKLNKSREFTSIFK